MLNSNGNYEMVLFANNRNFHKENRNKGSHLIDYSH